MSIIEQLQQINVLTKNGVNPKYKILLNKNPQTLHSLLEHTDWIIDQTEQSYRERLYCVVNDIKQQPLCKYCNVNPVSFITEGKKRNQYYDFCSMKCVHNAKQTKAKKQQTWEQNLGVDNPSKNKEISQRKQQTCLRNNGTNWPMQSQTVKDKSKQTIVVNYGVENVMKNQDVVNLNIEQKHQSHWFKQVTNTIHYRLLNDSRWLMYQHHDLKKNTTTIARELGVSPSYVQQSLHKHQIGVKNHFTSDGQQQIIDWLYSKLNTTIIINDRQTLLDRKELDIHIPDYNFAIEYNGLYWHSYNYQETAQQKNYHLNKTNQCLRQGINLVHIFEHEWINKPNVVLSRLSSLLQLNTTVGARNCSIEEISSQQANKLLASWHIQGGCPSKIRYALKYNGQHVAVMTFGKPRYTGQQYELLRYCTKPYINVVGGANKLFNKFIEQFNPTTIVSYADKRWSVGQLYKQLGFVYQHDSNPNYFYFKSSEGIKLFSRVAFQKHKLKDKLVTFDPNLTEAQNMFNNGYRRIWDCGNQVWVWYS